MTVFLYQYVNDGLLSDLGALSTILKECLLAWQHSIPFLSPCNFLLLQQVLTVKDSRLNPEAVLQKLPAILSDKSCKWPSTSSILGPKTPSLCIKKEPRTGQALGTKLKPHDKSTFIQLTVYWRTETNKLRIERRKESTVCLLRGSLRKDTSLRFK